jgi:hypothetical protein
MRGHGGECVAIAQVDVPVVGASQSEGVFHIQVDQYMFVLSCK